MSDHEYHELDEQERRLFAELPPESAPDPRELDHLVSALRAEGFLGTRSRGVHWTLAVAAADVRASNAYAGAVAQTDSTAIEVASRVLLGAAQAVARSNLDGGVSPSLTEIG